MTDVYTPEMDAIDIIFQHIDEKGIENVMKNALPFDDEDSIPESTIDVSESENEDIPPVHVFARQPVTRNDEEIITPSVTRNDKEIIIPAQTQLPQTTSPSVPAKLEIETVSVNGKAMPVEMKEDFDTSRNNIRTILDSGMTGIANLAKLAEETAHPRVYEILSNMMRTMGDLNKQLIELHKEKTKIANDLIPAVEKPTETPGAVTNNTIFVGSTKELQDFMNKKKQES